MERVIPDINYQRLADEIIIRAVKDYRRALKVLKKHPDNPNALHRKREVERFFHSDWYCVLTETDADYIIDRIRKEVDEE